MSRRFFEGSLSSAERGGFSGLDRSRLVAFGILDRLVTSADHEAVGIPFFAPESSMSFAWTCRRRRFRGAGFLIFFLRFTSNFVTTFFDGAGANFLPNRDQVRRSPEQKFQGVGGKGEVVGDRLGRMVWPRRERARTFICERCCVRRKTSRGRPDDERSGRSFR